MSNDEIAALQIKIDFLLDALQKIIACLPAIQDGGGFIVEHFDMDGEYMGSESIDPFTVVQRMHELATQALEDYFQKGEKKADGGAL